MVCHGYVNVARMQQRDTAVIVLSTKEEPKPKSEAFAVGANDYLIIACACR